MTEMTMPVITPLGNTLGGEVRGISLVSLVDDDRLRAAILHAWHDYGVLVFRDQSLSTEEQIAFASSIGEVEEVRTRKDDPDRKQYAMFVSNRHVEGSKGVLPTGEMNFHSDQCYYERPCKATILHALELPPSGGGNTLFASAYRAYDALEVDVKERISVLEALHVYDYDGSATQRIDRHAPDAPKFVHPVVVRHPDTGRSVLYVNRLMTDHIVGLDRSEGGALLERLFIEIERPEFVYAHEWQPGDVVMWDNRCTLHARTDFDPTEPRVLRRITVKGDRPRRAG